MKKILASTLLVFLVGFSIYQGTVLFKVMRKKTHNAYLVASIPDKIKSHKPITVVVMSYNNKSYYKKNLQSILKQDYDNYRVLYIDDCSSDGMSDEIGEYLETCDIEKKVSYQRNSQNRGALENLYRAVHSCSDEEIICVLDGDDFFAHEKVLSHLNGYYQNEDVWLTYGSYKTYPEKEQCNFSEPISNKILSEGSIRRKKFMTSHLRSFYASLFKQIKLEDLLLDGKFAPMCYDIATMIPMVEMAAKHAYFIPEVLYLYNRENVLCDDKKNFNLQQNIDKRLREKSSYVALKKSPRSEHPVDTKADVIAFSYDRPLQLYAFLESACKHLLHVNQIHVLYLASSDRMEEGYKQVKQAYPNVSFIQQNYQKRRKDFKPKLMSILSSTKASYVAFAVDDIIVKNPVDLKSCIESMQTTGAYGFYLKMGSHINYSYLLDKQMDLPHMISVGKDQFAWQFCSGSIDWNYPNTLDMTLYSKNQLIEDFNSLSFNNPNELEANWNEIADLQKTGLFFANSNVINIPLNLVRENDWDTKNMAVDVEELLQIFMEGKKIDISDVEGFQNNTVHMEFDFDFIERNSA